jgi:hypothetical protein
MNMNRHLTTDARQADLKVRGYMAHVADLEVRGYMVHIADLKARGHVAVRR